MRVEALQLFRFELELVRPLRSAASDERSRPVLLVCARTSTGDGWGECPALESPGYDPEYADGAEEVLRRHVLPGAAAALAELEEAGGDRTVGEQAELAAPAGRRFGLALGVRGHQMAKAALETALLDAELRSLGIGLASYLGAKRSRVPAGATVGLQPSPEAALEAVAEAVSAGFSRLKLKIAPGADVAVAAAVRLCFHELALQVDCNGAYRADEPSHMSALFELDQLGLLAIEQPLDPDDLVGHVDLVRRLRTPVLLDESVRSELAAASALRLEACDGLVVKPARLGGVLAARRVHGMLAASRRPGAVGGMLESGVGRAAALAVAALPAFTIAGDLGPSERYFAADLTEPHTMDDGSIAVPDGPGIGVAPLPEVLASRARLRAEVPVP